MNSENAKGEEMNHKKVFVSWIVLIVMLASVACSGAAAPAESETGVTYDENGIPVYGCLGSAEEALVDLECQEVTVAVENAYPNFNYIDEETGHADGWDYFVITEICRQLHCQPVFQECSWDIMIQSVADGLYDVAGDGISITEERDQIVDFSDPYSTTIQRLLARKGEDRFQTMEEFVAITDLVLGTQTGTTNYETAKGYLPEERINAFEQYPFAVQALLSKDVDVVLLDDEVGGGYIEENPEDLEFIGPDIASDSLGLIFPEGSDLVEPFNLALAELASNGFLAEAETKYP